MVASVGDTNCPLQLAYGTNYFFAITSTNVFGAESDFNPELSFTPTD